MTTWLDQAACRGLDPALFFPERGGSLAEPKAVCARCPVIDNCLEYVISLPRPEGTSGIAGVWGGTSERERRRIKSAHNKQAAA